MKKGFVLAFMFMVAATVAPMQASAGAVDASDSVQVAPEAPQASTVLVPRYQVTYMRSVTGNSLTVVSVTNQSTKACDVSVDWFYGFVPGTPSQTTTFTALGPGQTTDICSRDNAFTTCNATGTMTVIEGNARIASTAACPKIAVDARVIYVDAAEAMTGIMNPKIVKNKAANSGD